MSFRIDTFAAAFSRCCFRFTLLLPLTALTWQPGAAQSAIHGEFEFYSAVGVSGPPEPFSTRGRMRINARYARSTMLAFAEARVSHALLDPERGGQPGPFRMRLLEAFVDFYTEKLDIRIGHQLVVWGQMDGTFITDVVSPLDLREFLAQDFVDIRLAVPAVKASHFVDDWSVTGLVVLAPVQTLIPSEESPWFAVPESARFFDVRLEDDTLPELGVRALEPGLKVSYSGTEGTADLIYMYGRNRIPAFGKALELSGADGLQLVLTPEYYRRHVLGSRFVTTAVSFFVLEAEIAYESRLQTDVDPALLLDSPGVADTFNNLLAEGGHISSGLAAARSFGQTFLKVQFLGSLMTHYDDRVLRDRFAGAATILVQRSWRRDTYLTRLFGYYGQGGEYWANPSLGYAAGPGLNVSVGAHLFGGDADAASLTTTAFGLFSENDFVYVRLTLAF